MSSQVERPEPPERVANNPILKSYAWDRMHLHNENWVAACVGETGSGKSWGALRLAEVLDPEFTVDQVAFGVVEFMELVLDDSLGPGNIIVFEEASVEASHQEWYTKANKVLKQVLETWRHQNRGLIFTLPAFKLLDKSARGRCHALIQMTGKNESQGYSIAKYKYLQQDSDSGKNYRHYHSERGLKYKRIQLDKPSEHLREPYEDRKQQYTSELNRELLEELLEEHKDSAEEKPDAKSIAQEIIDSGLDRYIKEHPFNGSKSINTDLIEVDFDIGGALSKRVRAALEARDEVEV